jgi:hypothetical protein
VITVATERPAALSAGIDEVRVGPEVGTVDVLVVLVVVDVDVDVEVEVEVEVVVEVDVEVDVVVDVVDVEVDVVEVGSTVVEVLVVGEVSDKGVRGIVVEVEEVLEEVGVDAVDEVVEGVVDEVVEESIEALVEDELATDSAPGELCDVLGHMAPAITTITSAAMKICTVPCKEFPNRRFLI